MAYREAALLLALVSGLVVGIPHPSPAASLVENIQTHLYAGDTRQALLVARARLKEAPRDDQARFALGAVQFLQAIEHLAQALHKYGLRTQYEDTTGLSGLPFLRIPVPENPSPQKVSYAALRTVLQAFVSDLQKAEGNLSLISSTGIDLPLNIGLIRLDLNSDGVASIEEVLWRILKRVAEFPGLNEAEAAKLMINFDGSDVPWLRAYSHLLMAIAEFPLAHDWETAFETTFHGLFPKSGLPSSALLEKRTEFGGIADLIAFVHLNHWLVVEPERMHNVLAHLEAMVRLSRENWRLIAAETDDHNEWIPSPIQTGVLPRMMVTEERVAGWQQFLDEFEALLQGKKLLPHFRFHKGINLRRVFLEPTTFDIVLLIQGSAAIPYLEEGEFTTSDTWDQIMGLFGGQFFRYFVWIN